MGAQKSQTQLSNYGSENETERNSLQMVALPPQNPATKLQSELSFHHFFSRGIFSGSFLGENEEIKGSKAEFLVLFLPKSSLAVYSGEII